MDRGLVAKAVLAVVVLAVIVWFNEFNYPRNSLAVSSVKIDYPNSTMTFEYSGEKWFVKYPEREMPAGYTGIRVEFRDGKPAYIWVHTWYVAGISKYYNMVWKRVPVLDARKLS